MFSHGWPRWWLAALIAMTICLQPAKAAAAENVTVDLELVLAVDISLSMDEDEQRLQRDGYTAAFRNPEIIEAIKSGPNGRIAVTYVRMVRRELPTHRHPLDADRWRRYGHSLRRQARCRADRNEL